MPVPLIYTYQYLVYMAFAKCQQSIALNAGASDTYFEKCIDLLVRVPYGSTDKCVGYMDYCGMRYVMQYVYDR